MMIDTVQAELPHDLVEEVQAFIRDGWASNLSEVLEDALRRHLQSHAADLAESFLREDVAWGLHGREDHATAGSWNDRHSVPSYPASPTDDPRSC